jgi:hypothetical protein
MKWMNKKMNLKKNLKYAENVPESSTFEKVSENIR